MTLEKPSRRAGRRVDRDVTVSPDSATLHDVQKRLKNVEQKLDTILELLKRGEP